MQAKAKGQKPQGGLILTTCANAGITIAVR
jgi:hypothetical protein